MRNVRDGRVVAVVGILYEQLNLPKTLVELPAIGVTTAQPEKREIIP